jgi:integrase
MKFSELADAYQAARLYPAKIVDGKKVGGIKSLGPVLCSLAALNDFFGKQRVQSIRHSDLVTYKQRRLETRTIHNKQRKIASVNRELELARAIFRFAMQECWLSISPFLGEPVIDKAAENRRERVLTDDEEGRLLAACRKVGKDGRQRRLRLIPLLIGSWDTAVRRNQLLTLTWKDVDFTAGHYGTITVTVSNSKTESRREIGLTPRFRDALLGLWNKSDQQPASSVFGYRSNPKTAFNSACKDANVTDYTWHDGRHTATTRMMEATNQADLVKKITGHTQQKTFERYYNPSTRVITSVAEALSERNKLAEIRQSNEINEEKSLELIG